MTHLDWYLNLKVIGLFIYTHIIDSNCSILIENNFLKSLSLSKTRSNLIITELIICANILLNVIK